MQSGDIVIEIETGERYRIIRANAQTVTISDDNGYTRSFGPERLEEGFYIKAKLEKVPYHYDDQALYFG